MAAVEYGTIGIRPMGTYDPDTKYGLLHLVDYDGSSYVAHTDPPLGTLPTNTAYWQTSAQGTSKATANSVGTVKPDGTTTEVSADGSLSVKAATQNTLGLVRGSNGIKVGSDGSVDINTLFEQAAELANIMAGEAFADVLGKISKFMAVTMGLNENALLKNMLTNMDANDQNKIPTSAFVHTLYERIGMGTELTAGANLTAGLNTLNSNLDNVNSNLTNIGVYQIYTANSIVIPIGSKEWMCNWFSLTPGTYLIGFTSQPTVGVNTFLKITTNDPIKDITSYEIASLNSGSASKVINITTSKIVSVLIDNNSTSNYTVYSDPGAFFVWSLRVK